MTHAAPAVANQFLKLPGALGRLNQIDLQNLCYFAHGWTLAIGDRPLIAELPLALDGGPVFPELKKYTQYYGMEPIDTPIHGKDDNAFLYLTKQDRGRVFEDRFDAETGSIIEQVFKRYGDYATSRLSQLMYQPGTPWHTTYYRQPGNRRIANALTREYFLALAQHAAA